MWQGSTLMEHDPEEVQVRRAATVVVIRDTTSEPEVLMLKRNRRSVFVPDMWVFPGGAVDDEDHHDDVADRLNGLDAVRSVVQLSRTDAAAHWGAVLRETYEEAGLVLGRTADGRAWNDKDLAAHSSWRDALNAGTTDMATFLSASDLHLDASEVRYIARFITPMGPPRRYDARFFLAPNPSRQTASIDDDEAVEHRWVTPSAALDAYGVGHMIMMTPTVAILMRLARYSHVSEALATADSDAPPQTMRLRQGTDDTRRILFPGEAGYDAAEESEFGYIRI
ncbi:MAG: NUDIX hydrolase [Actinomycetia bacterium]|nr:NUDIX hydrolase [Actinomycetes bacterium]MCP4961026.1 NUDIX hydrolase [Actinomycetes bacterium]